MTSLSKLLDPDAQRKKKREGRADLHCHGFIGPEPYFIRRQGYEHMNVLQLWVESCFRRGIDICAVTAEQDVVIKGDIHDRLGWLVNTYAEWLSDDLKPEMLGENVLKVSNKNALEGEQKDLYLVSGRAVSFPNAPYKLTLVGTNQIPQGMSPQKLIGYCRGEHILTGADHPELLNDLVLPDFAIVHESSGFYNPSSWKIGSKLRERAEKTRTPGIAVSNAHRLQDVGNSYFAFDRKHLDTSSEGALLRSLYGIMTFQVFENHKETESISDFLDWYLLLRKGAQKNTFGIPRFETTD